MAERGSRTAAGIGTSYENLRQLLEEEGPTKGRVPWWNRGADITEKLRGELLDKGLKGFKKGGKVKKTGPAKLHKGEFVVKAPAAKKAGPSKLKALNQSQRDIAMLKRKRMV